MRGRKRTVMSKYRPQPKRRHDFDTALQCNTGDMIANRTDADRKFGGPRYELDTFSPPHDIAQRAE
jgi:hypothetical protein